MTIHTIPPVYDAQATCLLLGSFPSVKSREAGFYYAHPQNRFWRVLAGVYAVDVPVSVEEKKAFLLAHRLALWDVIHSCEITGSADSSITNVTVNDIPALLRTTQIRRVFTNGKKADVLYRKHLQAQTGMTAVCLPSTSPANAAYSLDRLTDLWRAALLGKEE